MPDRIEILSSDAVAETIFFPRTTELAPTDLVDVGEVKLACYRRDPFPEGFTLVHFHGNGELASDYVEYMLHIFEGAGLNLCFVDYRGYGFSGGRPNLVAQLEDNARLLDALGFAKERTIVYGRSLGGLYAVDLAFRQPGIAALVLESAIAELLEDWPLNEETRLLGLTEADLHREVLELFDNRSKLEAYRGELLVLHAENDWQVNKSHAQRLHAWCTSPRKKIVLFPRGDHNFILELNDTAIRDELAALAGRLER